MAAAAAVSRPKTLIKEKTPTFRTLELCFFKVIKIVGVLLASLYLVLSTWFALPLTADWLQLV